MSTNHVWLITGAARGLGADIARAALSAGHRVVATARTTEQVTATLGELDDLLSMRLDITSPESVQRAVDEAVEQFGRIDVLVNNAGNFYAGFFETLSPKQFDQQMQTNFYGPLNVTRAVLPIMRKQRSGRILSISSTAGLAGVDFCSAYSASKFALEGWMETLALDLEPFGVKTTIVEPGSFRTELLVEGASTMWPEVHIDDYEQRVTETIARWQSVNGHQGGDPKKLAAALIQVAEMDPAPARFMAGADSVKNAERKANALLAQAHAHRDLSSSLGYDEA